MSEFQTIIGLADLGGLRVVIPWRLFVCKFVIIIGSIVELLYPEATFDVEVSCVVV